MSFGFKKFEDKSNFELKNNFKNFENIPKKPSVYPRGSDGYVLESEVKFYNQDSLWTRWRRGYELYTFTQQILGSTAKERDKRGDYRLFFNSKFDLSSNFLNPNDIIFSRNRLVYYSKIHLLKQ